MDFIQSLSRGLEELRSLISKLHQDECNCMKQIVENGDQVINQPIMRQEVGLVESIPFQIVVTSQPHQQRQGNQRKRNTSKRRFTEINMYLAQALQYVLEAKLITFKDPPQNPNTASLMYNPNARCTYHSNSPGHDTNSCWTLRNKI